MNTKELLIAAKALIADPKNWLKGDYAEDENHRPAGIYSPEAKCFCSLGALRRTRGPMPRDRGEPANPNEDAHISAVGQLQDAMGTNIPHFNDTHTHAEVMAKWGEAINSL